ncbi:hypothetical protein FAI40_04810 [Acetobacteraceae bacterium]|nr:hypothetical protein FAI40_04810 [Acetobacteraceae bacterium]
MSSNVTKSSFNLGDEVHSKKEPRVSVSLALSNGQTLTGKLNLSDLRNKNLEHSALIHRQTFSKTGEFTYIPYPHARYVIAHVFGAGGDGGEILQTASGEFAVSSGGNSGNIAISTRFDARRLKKLIIGDRKEWGFLIGQNEEILLKVAPGQAGKTTLFKAGKCDFSPLTPPNTPSEGEVLSLDIPGASGERGMVLNADPSNLMLLGGKGGSCAYGHGGMGGISQKNTAQDAVGYGSGGGGAASGENSPRNPSGKGAPAMILLEEYF